MYYKIIIINKKFNLAQEITNKQKQLTYKWVHYRSLDHELKRNESI
jgi:hypothetical protein